MFDSSDRCIPRPSKVTDQVLGVVITFCGDGQINDARKPNLCPYRHGDSSDEREPAPTTDQRPYDLC